MVYNNYPIDPKAQSQIYSSNSNREFFLIHGYTGSPTDFNTLPIYLYKHFDATVKVHRLKGHGTNITDLDNLELDDFLNQIEIELKKDLKDGKSIVLGGVSFGAQIALLLASRYPVCGVFHVCVPYKLKFPFNMRFFSLLGVFKKYWKKIYSREEQDLREDAFYYKFMHIKGLSFIHIMNQLLNKEVMNITCPCLMIHSKKDSIGHYRSCDAVSQQINSKEKLTCIYDYKIRNHNIFYSPVYETVKKAIYNFFKDNKVFEQLPKKESIAAIIPAYNEEKRIKNVLEVLTQSQIFEEIIVVDDGSTDNTKSVVERFPVTYLRNEKNIGKGLSLDRGVQLTRASILFFCDADLYGLSPDIIKEIISPVIHKKVDMFIGIRNNIMQKSFMPFAKLSGDRALRRELWNILPNFYKRRYRNEVGLNFYAKFFGRGYDYRIFQYYQTLKEKKYGLLQGTYFRWIMNFDVTIAYMKVVFVDFFIFLLRRVSR